MRALSLISALLIAALAFSPCAFAKESTADGDAKADEKKEVKIPEFSIETLVPAKDALLDGWKVHEDDPGANDPSEEVLMALAEANGLDEDTAYVEQRIVQTPGGGKAAIAMMDIDDDPAKFTAALEAKATEAGWNVRSLAVPNRLLIVGGEPAVRDEVTEEMVAHVVYEFAAMARKRLNIQSWDKTVKSGAKAATKGFVKAGRVLSPKAGVLNAIESFFDLREYHAKKGEAESNKKKMKHAKSDAKEDEFLEKHRKAKKAAKVALNSFLVKTRQALDPSSPLPPRGTLLASLAGQGGGLLLEQKDDNLLDEAVKWLSIAVKSDSM